MKRIIIILASFIFMVGISGKTRVYTRNDYACMDIYNAYLASALLKSGNHDLLFTLLDNPSERLVLISKLKLDDKLELVKVKEKPNSFTNKDVDSIFKNIEVEFLKSDTIVCFVGYEQLYYTKARRDYNYLNSYQMPIFNSMFFKEAVKASGAKTNDEKIRVLKEWIYDAMWRLRLMSNDPWKYL